MPFLNKTNRTYQLQTNIPKDTLVANLQELIDKAQRDKWFSLANVDYKQMKLEADRLIVDRESLMANAYKGRGTITVVFERVNDNATMVKAEIKPLMIYVMFWFYSFLLILLSIYIISEAPNWQTIFGTLIGLTVAFAIYHISITVRRWRLESYLDFILSDLGIKEEMIENE